jgi:hypothetical protein
MSELGDLMFSIASAQADAMQQGAAAEREFGASAIKLRRLISEVDAVALGIGIYITVSDGRARLKAALAEARKL